MKLSMQQPLSMLWAHRSRQRTVARSLTFCSVMTKLKNFISGRVRPLRPLFVLFGIVLLWATALTYPWSNHHAGHDWMRHVMGGFFLLFGGLKLVNLRSFAPLFREYDIIAKRVPAYGYLYPFIEVALGIAYTFSFFLLATNLITVTVMSIGAIGIIQKLRAKPKFTCACLGGFFNIPLTWLTAAENIVMAAMATSMIFF